MLKKEKVYSSRSKNGLIGSRVKPVKSRLMVKPPGNDLAVVFKLNHLGFVLLKRRRLPLPLSSATRLLRSSAMRVLPKPKFSEIEVSFFPNPLKFQTFQLTSFYFSCFNRIV